MSITLKFQRDHFDLVLRAIDEGAQHVIPDIAQAIVQDASYKAPVDTGSEEKGFYLVTKGRDTYGDAVSAAQGVNPHVQILDHIAQTADSYHGYVSHAPEHTLYQEMGTAHMSAQPALIPAAEAHRQDFEDTLTAAIQAAITEALR
jgi:hypothetical protein